MKRFSAMALVLFVAVQATAVASTRMVCRYTGKVMENCPCPERAASPELEQPGCCTVLNSDAAPVAAREREQVQVRSVELVLPAWGAVPLPEYGDQLLSTRRLAGPSKSLLPAHVPLLI